MPLKSFAKKCHFHIQKYLFSSVLRDEKTKAPCQKNANPNFEEEIKLEN